MERSENRACGQNQTASIVLVTHVSQKLIMFLCAVLFLGDVPTSLSAGVSW